MMALISSLWVIYLTDGFVLNGATSLLKSVLCYMLDKDLTPIWNSASFLWLSRCITARGSSPTKVKAGKSFLLTEGSPEVVNNINF